MIVPTSCRTCQRSCSQASQRSTWSRRCGMHASLGSPLQTWAMCSWTMVCGQSSLRAAFVRHLRVQSGAESTEVQARVH
eukprot:187405-Amphidinium_carterae.1